MTISNPSQAQMFSANYDALGQYLTDDDLRPFYNPPDSGVMYQMGEPVLLPEGAGYKTYICQSPIRPGEVGYLVKRYTVLLPCDLSADVQEGQLLFWEPSSNTVQLTGDVTNGFTVGCATFEYVKGQVYDLGADDRPICGTEDSTHIRVISIHGANTGKGTFA